MRTPWKVVLPSFYRKGFGRLVENFHIIGDTRTTGGLPSSDLVQNAEALQVLDGGEWTAWGKWIHLLRSGRMERIGCVWA